MIFFFFFRKTGFMNPCIAIKKRTRPARVCPYDFLSGVRCAPAFFERCGRFAKNCVCSRLHSPQRLTRLCGCCDEPHFCFRKNGFHESLYHSQKKRTRPVRVCPILYRAAKKDIAFKSGRHYRIPAIFRFATQPAPTLSMTALILAVYFFNLRLIPYIPTMPFQKTILCYNNIGSRRRLTILVLAEVQLWK